MMAYRERRCKGAIFVNGVLQSRRFWYQPRQSIWLHVEVKWQESRIYLALLRRLGTHPSTWPDMRDEVLRREGIEDDFIMMY